jgi:hypothetical protein
MHSQGIHNVRRIIRQAKMFDNFYAEEFTFIDADANTFTLIAYCDPANPINEQRLKNYDAREPAEAAPAA